MNGGEGGELFPGGAARAVVKRNSFDDSSGQAPNGEQVGAGFGMGRAEQFRFDFVNGNSAALGECVRAVVFAREVRCEQQFAQIVEQCAGEGGIGGVLIDTFHLGDAAGQCADGEAMLPNLVGGKIERLDAIELIVGLDGQDERFDNLDAQNERGFAWRGNGSRQAEDGRIDRLEDLGGDRHVPANEIAHGAVAGWRIERLEDFAGVFEGLRGPVRP